MFYDALITKKNITAVMRFNWNETGGSSRDDENSCEAAISPYIITTYEFFDILYEKYILFILNKIFLKHVNASVVLLWISFAQCLLPVDF
jgi:hypothetical protein